MSEKQELIKRMLELQKKFIEFEHEHGVDPHDYYAPPGGHPLDGYRAEYLDLANRVVDMAHAEKGSRRD